MNSEDIKALLEQAITNYCQVQKPPTAGYLFIGIKPAAYTTPAMWIGTGLPQDSPKSPAHYIEIFINDTCVFRDYAVLNNTEDYDKESFKLQQLKKTLFNVLCYGIGSAKTFLDDYRNTNTGKL